MPGQNILHGDEKTSVLFCLEKGHHRRGEREQNPSVSLYRPRSTADRIGPACFLFRFLSFLPLSRLSRPLVLIHQRLFKLGEWGLKFDTTFALILILIIWAYVHDKSALCYLHYN